MWEKIFNLAISNGIWAVLFMALFVFQLKDSHSREAKYQNTIEACTKALDVINDVKNDVEDIKNALVNYKVIKNKRLKDENTTKS